MLPQHLNIMKVTGLIHQLILIGQILIEQVHVKMLHAQCGQLALFMKILQFK